MAEKDREARRARRLASVSAAVLGRRGAAAADAARYGRRYGRLASLIADPKFVEIVADHAGRVGFWNSDRYLISAASSDPGSVRIRRDGRLLPPRTTVLDMAWRFNVDQLASYCTRLWGAIDWIRSVLIAARGVIRRVRSLNPNDIDHIVTLRLESGPLLGARIRTVARYLSALRLARRTGATRGLTSVGQGGECHQVGEWMLAVAAFRVLRPRFEAMAGADYPGALDWLAARLEALVRRGRDRAAAGSPACAF